MTEKQFSLMHGFFLSLCSMLTAETLDRRRWERETKAAAELMDKYQIPMALQNIVAEAAADGRYFPLNSGRVARVREVLAIMPELPASLERQSRAASVLLGSPVTVAELLAAKL